MRMLSPILSMVSKRSWLGRLKPSCRYKSLNSNILLSVNRKQYIYGVGFVSAFADSMDMIDLRIPPMPHISTCIIHVDHIIRHE